MSLKVAYPKFFLTTDPSEVKAQIDTWHEMFTEEPFALIAEAVKALICSLKFPPTVADIKEKLAFMLKPKALSEMEAWHIVKKAVDNYQTCSTFEGVDKNGEEIIIYASTVNKKTFDEMPPLIKRIVGDTGQLREWFDMDTSTFNSVIQSNFMRSYTALVKQEAEYNMLPESTKAMMAQIEGTRMKQLEAGV